MARPKTTHQAQAGPVEQVTVNPLMLLLRKMLLAALVAFGGVLVPALLNILDGVHKGQNFDFSTNFWFALIAGAVAAGLRAAVALSPINFVPSDKLHTLGAARPREVIVRRAA